MQIMIMVDALFIISHFLKEKDIVAVLTTELQSPVVSVKSISLYARKNFPKVILRSFQRSADGQTISRVYFPKHSRCAQIIAGQGTLSV
ncbi:hypothetical protein D5086_004629 [Populus alba]|uniref:Uncharacterized protein n=1 Tax=Populus alba TaxID=43335 RepID=A0ACC4CS61_POPAL